jgi:hypothetical protein
MVATGTTTPRRKRSDRGDAKAAVSVADAARHPDAAPTTVTMHIPLALRRRRGRKVLVAPDGDDRMPLMQESAARSGDELTPAVRTLARAFRWRMLLEAGAAATVQEIAAWEKINPSYVSRVLRLTLLAPEVVDALMAPRAADAQSLDRLMKPFPVEWMLHGLLVKQAGG